MSNPTELVRTVFCQAKSGNYIAHQSHVTCEVCAQPEGEAPQAKDTPESMAQSNARFAIDGAIQYGRENRNEPPGTDHWLYEYWNIGRQLAQLGATGWDNVTPAPAASLSPLCGAQHAESGKEAQSAYEILLEVCRGGALALIELRSMVSDPEHVAFINRALANPQAFAAQLDGGQEGSESNG